MLDFENVGQAAADRLLDRQLHITSAEVIPDTDDVSSNFLALGTTLGYVCVLDTSKLLIPGHHTFSDVVKLRWKAHKGSITSMISSSKAGSTVMITAGTDSRVLSWQVHGSGAHQVAEVHLPGSKCRATLSRGLQSPCLAGGTGLALCGTSDGQLLSLDIVRSSLYLLTLAPYL
jgi:hypothetical protein